MYIIYNILFLGLGIIFGGIIIYIWAHFRYENKKQIDTCYNERSQFKKENENLKYKVKELEEKLKDKIEELEEARREINEKNKYLSEDKVVIERLSEVKELSDKIGKILASYDKKMIEHLLNICEKASKNKETEEKGEKFGF